MKNKREKETLLVDDLIEILQISRNSAYSLIKNNPPFRVVNIGRSWRIPSPPLFAWLDGLADTMSEQSKGVVTNG